MSARDTFVQIGFVMIVLGATFATWALLTGPLARYTKLGPTPRRRPRKKAPTPDRDDPRT